LLYHILKTEREAEEFSILMMQRFGYKRPEKDAIRSANSSLLQHILILRYGILITAIQTRRLLHELENSGCLKSCEIIELTDELQSKLDEIVDRARDALRLKCVAFWDGKIYRKRI
jgi:hypothetical protein